MNLDTLTTRETQNDTGSIAGKSQHAPFWSVADILALLDAPFNDLIYRAQTVHRQYHDPNGVQLSTLISVKTGGCPEDCGYCPQAARYHTGVENQNMLSLDEVVGAAAAAKAKGASRFCMGAAWRGPKQRDIEKMTEMVRAVKSLGMETCATLGLLKPGQAQQLGEAGILHGRYTCTARAPKCANCLIADLCERHGL